MSLFFNRPIRIEEEAGQRRSTNMAEERLILAVSDNPVIYNLKLKGYHNPKLPPSTIDIVHSQSPNPSPDSEICY